MKIKKSILGKGMYLLNRKEFAKIKGVGASSITEAIKRGDVIINKEGKIDIRKKENKIYTPSSNRITNTWMDNTIQEEIKKQARKFNWDKAVEVITTAQGPELIRLKKIMDTLETFYKAKKNKMESEETEGKLVRYEDVEIGFIEAWQNIINKAKEFSRYISIEMLKVEEKKMPKFFEEKFLVFLEELKRNFIK